MRREPNRLLFDFGVLERLRLVFLAHQVGPSPPAPTDSSLDSLVSYPLLHLKQAVLTSCWGWRRLLAAGGLGQKEIQCYPGPVRRDARMGLDL